MIGKYETAIIKPSEDQARSELIEKLKTEKRPGKIRKLLRELQRMKGR